MRVLIIQTESIGRIVASTPIIRSIKDSFSTKPDVLVNPKNTPSVEENPYLGKVITWKDAKGNEKNYDLVIDLVNNKASRKLSKKLGKKLIPFKTNKKKEWLFINLKVNKIPSNHRIHQQFEQLSSIGLKWDNNGLDYFIPDKDVVEDNWLPESHQNGYAVLAMSSPTKTQQLPLERMIELCDRINKPIVLLGEKHDNQIAKRIEEFFKKGSAKEEKEIEGLNKKTTIFNGCGKFNINQQASIIEKSKWVFTHENDLMYIASAFKKQIFSIWGSSSPLFGEYPFETKFTIFENKKLSCRPCARTGYEKCPKGHFKCLNEVTFDFYLPD